MALTRKFNLSFLLFMLAVNTAIFAQEKPVFTGEPDEPGPGMIRIEGLIKEIRAGDTICGRSYDSILVVEIAQIIAKGRGLTKTLSVSQVITIGLSDQLMPEKRLLAKQRADILLQEILCLDSEESGFRVVKVGI